MLLLRLSSADLPPLSPQVCRFVVRLSMCRPRPWQPQLSAGGGFVTHGVVDPSGSSNEPHCLSWKVCARRLRVLVHARLGCSTLSLLP